MLNIKSMVVLLVGVLAFVGVSQGDSEPMGVPALVLIEQTPSDKAFEKAQLRKPLELTSAKEAADFFDEKQLEAIEKEVDWAKQTVLVFAWQGSGQDKFEAEVKRNDEDEPFIEFQYTGGLTRDLRRHKYVYAVRKGVEWKWIDRGFGGE